MFTVIYRWRVKTGQEQRFRDGWRQATLAIFDQYHSLGSRLHRADDGSFVAYAQWRSRSDWEDRQIGKPAADEAFAMMRESAEGKAEILCLEALDDLFKDERAESP